MRHSISFQGSIGEERLLHFATQPTMPEKPRGETPETKAETRGTGPKDQHETESTASESVTQAGEDVQGVQKKAEITTSASANPDVVRKDPTVKSAEQKVEGAIRSVEGPAAATVEKDAKGNTTISFELPAGNGEWPDISYQAPGHSSAFQRCDGRGRTLDRNTVSTGDHSKYSPYFMKRDRTPNGYRYTIQADPGVVFKVKGVDLTPRSQAVETPAPKKTEAPKTKEAAPDNRLEVARDLWNTLRGQIESGYVESAKGEMIQKFEAAVRALPEMDRVKLFEETGLNDGVVIENNEEGAGQKFRLSVDTNEQVFMTDVVEAAPMQKQAKKKKERKEKPTKKAAPVTPSTKPAETSATKKKTDATPERAREPELKDALGQLEFHLSAGHGIGTETDGALRRLNDVLRGKTREQRVAALVAVGLASQEVNPNTGAPEQRFTPKTVKDGNNKDVEYRIFTDFEGSAVQVELVEPKTESAQKKKEKTSDIREGGNRRTPEAQANYDRLVQASDVAMKKFADNKDKPNLRYSLQSIEDALRAEIDELRGRGDGDPNSASMRFRNLDAVLKDVLDAKAKLEVGNKTREEKDTAYRAMVKVTDAAIQRFEDNKDKPNLRYILKPIEETIQAEMAALRARGDGDKNAKSMRYSALEKALADVVGAQKNIEDGNKAREEKDAAYRAMAEATDAAIQKFEANRQTSTIRLFVKPAQAAVEAEMAALRKRGDGDKNAKSMRYSALEKALADIVDVAKGIETAGKTAKEQETKYRAMVKATDATLKNLEDKVKDKTATLDDAKKAEEAIVAELAELSARGDGQKNVRSIRFSDLEKALDNVRTQKTAMEKTTTVDTSSDVAFAKNRFKMIKDMLNAKREKIKASTSQKELDGYRKEVQEAIKNRQAYLRERAEMPGVDKANDAFLTELRSEIIELQNDYLQPFAEMKGSTEVKPAATKKTPEAIPPSGTKVENEPLTVKTVSETRESRETPEQRYARAKQEQLAKRDAVTKYGEATDQWTTLEAGKMDFDKKNPRPFLYKRGTLEGNPVLLAYSPKGGIQVMDMEGNWRFMKDLTQTERAEMLPVETDIRAQYDAVIGKEQQKQEYKNRYDRNGQNHRMEEECLKNPKADAEWFRSTKDKEPMWAQNQEVKKALEEALAQAEERFVSAEKPTPQQKPAPSQKPTQAPSPTPEPAPSAPTAPKENDDLSRENAELRRQIAELTKRIEELLARIKALEDKQNKPATPEQPGAQPPANPGEKPATPTPAPTEAPKPTTPSAPTEAPKPVETKEAINDKIKNLETENTALVAEWAKILEGGHAALHTKDPTTGKEGIVRLEEIVKKKEENDREIARLKGVLAAPEANEGLPEGTNALIAERTKLNEEISGLRTKLDSASMARIQAIDKRIAAIDAKLSEIRTKLEAELQTLKGKTDQAALDRVKTIDAELTTINAVIKPSATPVQSPEAPTEDVRIAKLAPNDRAKFEAATTEWGTIGAIGNIDAKGMPFIYRKASVTVNGKKETRVFAYGESGYFTLDLDKRDWVKMEATNPMIAEASLAEAPAKYAALPNKPASLKTKERLKFNNAGTEWARMGANGNLDSSGVPFLYKKATITVEGTKTTRLFGYTEKSGYWMMDEKGEWTSLKPENPVVAEAGLGNAKEIFTKLDNTPSSMPEKERAKFNAATTFWSLIGKAGNVDKAKVPFLYVKADVPTTNDQPETRLFGYSKSTGYHVMDRSGVWTKIDATNPMIASAGIGNADKIDVKAVA